MCVGQMTRCIMQLGGGYNYDLNFLIRLRFDGRSTHIRLQLDHAATIDYLRYDRAPTRVWAAALTSK